MLAKILSGAIVGLEAVPIVVEVDVAAKGLPNLTIVGLPDKAVEEAKERVRAALHNTGIDFPARRITINLAPADIPKEGPTYDLPIAIGILFASKTIATKNENINNAVFIGELSLDGSIRQSHGVLPLALMVKNQHFSAVFIPSDNVAEAAVVKDISIFGVNSLKEVIDHLIDQKKVRQATPINFHTIIKNTQTDYDMADIHGQEQAKRALEIAAAGGHNIFMNGSPGSGKTMLARTFPTILPDLTEEEALEVTKIYSITGNLKAGQSLITIRPFRSPHHTTSRHGLIGGGTHPRPGEISLAHRGVLFLDELPEFPRHVLESLRQPLEDGVVQISRASGSVSYPCRFTLLAAANPCPCGFYLSTKKTCTCSASEISRYQKKISGPLLDRIDLYVEVPEVEVSKLTTTTTGADTSIQIKDRVQSARQMQVSRFQETTLKCNSEMTPKHTKKYCPLNEPAKQLLSQATTKLGLTARSYFKTIKVARTIADLEGSLEIDAKHLAEALQYRHRQL